MNETLYILNSNCYQSMTDSEKIDYIFNYLYNFYSSVELCFIIFAIVILILLYITIDNYYEIKKLKNE